MLDAARLGFRAIAGEGVVLTYELCIVGGEDTAQGPEPRMIRTRLRRCRGIVREIDAKLVLPLSVGCPRGR